MSVVEQLQVRPYQERITAFPSRNPAIIESQRVREELAKKHYDAGKVVAANKEVLALLPETPFRTIGQKFAKGEQLTFEEAFLGMTFVVAATNTGIYRELERDFRAAHNVPDLKQGDLRGPAQTFLTVMAGRETRPGLTPEEIAGMAAAGMMDLNLRIGVEGGVLETGGMGGDKGFIINGEKQKVINASTLSAIVLSSMDVPVIKHGSYANTSKVGSTEAIEKLGINFHQASFEEIQELLRKTGFYFSDAHIAKTLHDLSHDPLVHYETVNHVVGPLTPPVAKETTLHKIVGVNDGVHPETFAKAYEILHDRGYQTVGNVLVISGLSQDFPGADVLDITDKETMKPFMMLDEVSPYETLLGVVQDGKYMGCTIITAEDFGIKIDPEKIHVVNAEEQLLSANERALAGLHEPHANYLAMNAALGLLATDYLSQPDAFINGRLHQGYMQEAFQRCREAIMSGKAAAHLDRIRELSQPEKQEDKKEGTLLDDVDLVIFDVDDTLIHPRDKRAFYGKYGEVVETTIANYLGISQEQGKQVADHYRTTHNGAGELALYAGTIGQHFPELGKREPNFNLLFDAMSRIDPTGYYDSHEHVALFIQKIRDQGIKVVALTDSPTDLSLKLLTAAGIDPETAFDFFIGASRDTGPHKSLRGEQIFAQIAKTFDVPHDRILAVGDNYARDIAPALALGMKICYMGEKTAPQDFMGEKADSIEEVFYKMGLIMK